jgi:hypothetical protein
MLMVSTYLKKTAALAAAVCALASMTACGDDEEASTPASAYPREVAVEYKVTSSSGLSEANVMYTNETGGNSSDTPKLPFSKKFRMTVKQYDSLAYSVTSTAGELTGEILVDDKVVDTKTFTSTSNVVGSSAYIFQ